jgi:hypothetical protein
MQEKKVSIQLCVGRIPLLPFKKRGKEGMCNYPFNKEGLGGF